MPDSGGDVFYNRAKFCTDKCQECIASNITGWDVLTDYLHGLGREEFGCGIVTRILSGLHIRQKEYLDCACVTVTIEDVTAIFKDHLFEECTHFYDLS